LVSYLLTIGVEALILRFYLQFNWIKSVLISCVGNFVSGYIGTYTMMWGMIGWHLMTDWLVPGATFGKLNWIATYILMCLGSVCIEVLAVKLISGETFKRLFKPLLVGNALSYIIIAIAVAMGKGRESRVWKDPMEKFTERIYYVPEPDDIVLLDSSRLKLGVASTRLSFEEHHIRLRQRYGLEIPFVKDKTKEFQFELRLLESDFAGGISEGVKLVHPYYMSDTIKIALEEKNPDASIGWKQPIITDTIKFIRLYQSIKVKK
jgi:hypothetical protein